MANTPLQIKRSLTTSSPIRLNVGEPAYSYSSNTLFIGAPDSNGAIAIGGYDSFVRSNSAYSHANSAYIRANNALNANVGGLITGDVTIQGNLSIVGGSIGANVPMVLIGDNIITLNTSISQSGQPTMNAGIEIDRGAQPNVYLLWNETVQRWQFTNNGTTYDDLGGSATASYANSAFIKANASFDHANAAYISQNATGQYANSAFIKANASFDHANAAYANANTKVSRSGDRMSGSLEFFGANLAIGDYQYAGGIDLWANSGTAYAQVNYANTNYLYVDPLGAAMQSPNAQVTVFTDGVVEVYSANVESGNKYWRFYSNGEFTWADGTTQNTSPFATATYANSAYRLANSNFAHANSGFDHANAAFIKANSAYESQNSSGEYANAAFTKANGAFIHANSGFIQANAAYQSQNATGNVANAAFANANGAFARANAAFANANGAFARANAAFANANGAFAMANAAYNTGNAAFIRANNSLNANVGGQVTGDVVIVGNVTSNTLTTTGSNGSITGANAIFTNYIFAANGNVDLFIYSSLAYAQSNAALAAANASFANANAAFARANAAFANANGAFAAANAAYIQANSAFIKTNAAFDHANSAYESQNATGQYANAAFIHANSGFIQTNSAFNHANAAFANANGAFAAANAAYIQANSAFIQTNSAFDHANAAYLSQNATGQYANAAFTLANGAFIHANSGFIQVNASFDHANAAFANANGAFAAANAAYLQANSAFIQTNAAFGHANAAYISQNATGQYANAAFNHANSSFIKANAAYATANVKTETFVQATAPVSANVDDIWIDSSSGIQYVYVNSNSANQWVEFGPYSSPLNGTANIQFADQTIFTVKTTQPLVLLSSNSDIHLNASANVVTLNVVPSNPTISLGSSDRPFKNVWISNASIHFAGNGLVSGQPVKITNDANNVVIDTGGLKILGGALQANSFLGVSQLYALNVESSFVVSNATFSSTNALVKIVGSNTGATRPAINPGYMLHITGKQNTASRIINDSFGADSNTYPVYAGRAARGTPEAPTAVKAGDILARYTGNGYDGTNYAAFGTGRIDIIATEDHTSLNKGTSIILSTMSNNTNILSNIANFDGNTSTIYGTLLVTKGYLQYPRAANVANTTAVTIDFANDSMIRCTVNSAMTVTFTNFLAGKSVELWVTNITTIARTVTHGVAATNSTNGATTKSIPGNTVAVFKYMSWDGNLANTQVVIHQG